MIISILARKYNSKELEKCNNHTYKGETAFLIARQSPISNFNFNVSALPIQANRELDVGSPPCRPDDG
jgi:hypothetical protein